LQRGAKEGVNADNLSLEVNSSRHAYAVTPNQVIQSVYVSIVTIAAAQDGAVDNSAKLLTSSKKHLGLFKCLLAKYVKSNQVNFENLINAWTCCNCVLILIPFVKLLQKKKFRKS
jgi:hypothetical protein